MAKKKKKADTTEADEMAKLMKLTQLMKANNVKVAPEGPPKSANKWRARDPKFAPKPEKSANTVEAGGMQVDPARQQEYENWRKDKLEEQTARREAAERHAKAAAEARQ